MSNLTDVGRIGVEELFKRSFIACNGSLVKSKSCWSDGVELEKKNNMTFFCYLIVIKRSPNKSILAMNHHLLLTKISLQSVNVKLINPQNKKTKSLILFDIPCCYIFIN